MASRSPRQPRFTTSSEPTRSSEQSFTELTALPVDFVKIGKPFTNGWTEDHANSTAVIKAIVDVAHALGKQVIAEAVETHEVAQDLHTLGVEFAQGFLFGPPKPAYLAPQKAATAAA